MNQRTFSALTVNRCNKQSEWASTAHWSSHLKHLPSCISYLSVGRPLRGHRSELWIVDPPWFGCLLPVFQITAFFLLLSEHVPPYPWYNLTPFLCVHPANVFCCFSGLVCLQTVEPVHLANSAIYWADWECYACHEGVFWSLERPRHSILNINYWSSLFYLYLKWFYKRRYLKLWFL